MSASALCQFCHPFAIPFAVSGTLLLQVSPSNPRQFTYSSSPPLHASCLLSLLICMVIPSYFPSMPPYRVLSKSSLLHRQAGHQDITFWINSQHCLLGTGHQRTFLREQPLDHLLLPGHSSSPCPSPFTQPRCFTSSPHYLSSPYLASLFYFFTKLFVLFSSDLWPGKPDSTGL